MVSSVEGNAPIQIHQDANLYSLSLEAGKEIHFPVKEGRQLYLVQIEGSSVINGETFVMRDAKRICRRRYSHSSERAITLFSN